MKLIKTILPILSKLPYSVRKKYLLLAFVTVISSGLEIITLSLLYPFINAILEQQSGKGISIPYLSNIILSKPEYAVILIISLLISASLKIFYVVRESKLSHQMGHIVGLKLFDNILSLKYSEHKESKTSDFIALIINKVNVVIYQGLLPIFRILNGLTLVTTISIYLITTSPLLTLIILFGLILLYIIYGLSIRNTISSSAETVNQNQNQIIKIIQDSLGSIKEIIISKKKNIFIQSYSYTSIRYKEAQAYQQIMSSLPKQVIEPLVIIILVSLITIYDQESLAQLIVIFYGLLRILPSAQVIYYNFQTFNNGLPSIIEVSKMLERQVLIEKSINSEIIKFQNLKLNSIEFKVENKTILSELSIEISRGDRIGIIGSSGSGKTTLIDVIMGLLEPSKGQILLNEKKLDYSNKHLFQEKIGHVKQDVFILDDTLENNILFGSTNPFDKELLISSIENAQLSEMVRNLPNGVKTYLGENGSKISGGQRQRIGLARLFYSQKEILILDEATSALDISTEEKILDKIYNLDSNHTIVMISHKPQTLKKCTKVYDLS